MLRTLTLMLLLILSTPASGVINGRPAADGDAPSTVAIVVSQPTGDWVRQCGGSLVTSTLVVTSAHCLYDDDAALMSPWSLGVIAGQRALGAADVIPVQSASPHPGYKPIQEVGADIAVIELARPVSDVPTLAVAGRGQQRAWRPGRIATIAGWGADAVDAASLAARWPDALQVARVPLVSAATCRLLSPLATGPDVACAGGGKGAPDACTGDSGGPLMTADDSGAPLLVGLVRSGDGCAKTLSPGVYTLVAPYADWLESLGVPTRAGVAPTTPRPRATARAARIVAGRVGSLTWIRRGAGPISEDVVVLTTAGAGSAAKTLAWLRTARTRGARKSVRYRPPTSLGGQTVWWCVVPTDVVRSGASSCHRLDIIRP